MARVPPICDDVMKLCRLIHPSNIPFYVRLKEWPHARESECYENVRERVQMDGGKIQHGWALWQPSGAFLAAEHHAVYEPPLGSHLIDITPHKSIVQRILFLPDDRAVYENKRIDNKRLRLVDDGRLDEFIRLNSEKIEIENSLQAEPATSISKDSLEIGLTQIRNRIQELKTELDRDYPLPLLRKNDPCFCGGSKSYGRCHGSKTTMAKFV